MGVPDRDDAQQYLKLLEITQGGGQVEARRWFFWEFEARSYEELDQRYPKGSVERDHLLNVLGFFESAGVLVHVGLLNQDIWFAAPLGLDLVWDRMKQILPEWREASRDSATWWYVMWMGHRYEDWRRTVWPAIEREASPG